MGLLGVVLCGGKSSRMGKDKGLLKNGQQTWAEKQKNLLQPFCDKVLVSIRTGQFSQYSRVFHKDILVFDEISAVSGPARGILTIHKAYPEQDLLVLACDIQNIQTRDLDILVQTYKGNPSSIFTGFNSPRGIEPMAGIYSAKGLTLMHQDNDINKGLYRFIQNSGSVLIDSDNDNLLNFNTPDSLEIL